MSAGTIALTNNTDIVTGTGTTFTTELVTGDFVVATVGGITYTLPVKTVNSNTQVTLISKYPGPTQANAAWNAVPRATQNQVTAALVAQATEALRAQNYDKANWQAVFSASGNITVLLPDGTSYTGPAWNGITTTLDGKATKGVNSDITSLSGLTTALSVEQGGTGAKTASTAWKALLDGRTVATARSDLGLGSSGVVTFGGFELTASTPFIDFHYNNSTADYDYRLINYASGILQGVGSFDSTRGFISRAGNNGAYNNLLPWNLYWNYGNNTNLLAAFVGTTQVGNLAFSTSSDKELKKDIVYITENNASKEVSQWRPVTFKYKARGIIDESDTQYGFIANDLVQISPECVRGSGLPEDYDIDKDPNNTNAYYLDQMAIIVKMVLAIQAQQQTITSQSEAITSLQNRIAAFEGSGL
jgi:hypothetical protein